MLPKPLIPNPPPGQERSYPESSQAGRIPFNYAPAGLEGETAYWIWGDLASERVPLITLHGGPGCPHSYLLPISLLSQDFGIPVVMYDQIGSGESTRFTDRKGDEQTWTPDLFIAELENVISKLGIKEFDVLGHSWGGRLAALFAIRKQPAGLRKLIICNVSTHVTGLVEAWAHLRKQMPYEVQETLDRCVEADDFNSEEGRQAMMYIHSLHSCRVQPFPKELIDAITSMQQDDTVYRTMLGSSPFAIKGSLSRMPGLVEDRLNEITEETCPGGLLIVSGRYDSCAEDVMTGWSTLPQCKTKWERFALSSHFVMLEETEAFISAIGTFVSEP